MFAPSKIKWLGSIALAGVLLTLAFFGGTWGTNYSARASVNIAPIIESLTPASVLAGSPDTVVIISGSNFGDIGNTRVRLQGNGVDIMVEPLEVLPDGISVIISDTLLVDPTLYIVTVVTSNADTVPIIPIQPPWDEESNQVPFFVYGASYILLPIINNNATH